jgi:hypothetical protein
VIGAETAWLVLVNVTGTVLPEAALSGRVFGSLWVSPWPDMVKCAVGPTGAWLTVSERGLVVVDCCGLLLSWTPTMGLNVPKTVGVPDSTPVVGFMVKPLG